MKLPIINSQAAICGEWSFTVLDGASRKVLREYAPFKNLVLDLGLDRMGETGALFSHCRIGTGTTAAAAADTQLQSQSAATSNAISSSATNAGSPNYESISTIVFEFALGAVVGNMAEIGAGWTASTASTLFSRARINDSGGSPTTITVLVTEILQATYRVTIYPKLTDDTGTVTIGGVSYDYTSRRYNAATVLPITTANSWITAIASPQTFSGTLSSTTGSGPTGGAAAISFASADSYTNGTYYNNYNLSASISQGNTAGGIRSIGFNFTDGAGLVIHRQIEFAATSGGATIPKDNTKTMTLVIRNSWARYP
jgi:hypothetical protein